jgi:hypothetical protein
MFTKFPFHEWTGEEKEDTEDGPGFDSLCAKKRKDLSDSWIEELCEPLGIDGGDAETVKKGLKERFMFVNNGLSPKMLKKLRSEFKVEAGEDTEAIFRRALQAAANPFPLCDVAPMSGDKAEESEENSTEEECYASSEVAWLQAMVEKQKYKELREKPERDQYLCMNNTRLFVDLVSLVCCGVHVFQGFYPRAVQIIALIVFLNPGKDEAGNRRRGSFGNVATGEGKTLITAMVATTYALFGLKVDVVTSSKVLAERDCSNDPKEGWGQFFKMFNLQVACNCDAACDAGSVGEAERKKRYAECDVIYGEAGYFQRDLLLTRFFGRNIRQSSDAIGDVCILDEVDNMVVDNAERTLYISHNITDMRYLRGIFLAIWTGVNGRTEREYSEKSCDRVHDYIYHQIHVSKDLKVPSTLLDFIAKNLMTWIENAYAAKYMAENDSYIIGDAELQDSASEVVVMDKSTGVEQLNTHWSNGLHTFMSLKHGAEIKDESLKAVFISNIKFFCLYKELSGMTGTLGDAAECNLIMREFNVGVFDLPRFKRLQFFYDDDFSGAHSSEAGWKSALVKDVESKMSMDAAAPLREPQKKMYRQHLETANRDLKVKTKELSDAEDRVKLLQREIEEGVAFQRRLSEEIRLLNRFASALYSENKRKQLDCSKRVYEELLKDDHVEQEVKLLAGICLDRLDLIKEVDDLHAEIAKRKHNLYLARKILGVVSTESGAILPSTKEIESRLQEAVDSGCLKDLAASELDAVVPLSVRTNRALLLSMSPLLKSVSLKDMEFKLSKSNAKSGMDCTTMENRVREILDEKLDALKLSKAQTSLKMEQKEVAACQRDLTARETRAFKASSDQLRPRLEGGAGSSDRRRAVLIICESVRELNCVKQYVKSVARQDPASCWNKTNFFTYDRAYKGFQKEMLEPGDIVFATNIAGRGTDLKLSDELEINGGLHVIISYMCENVRIELQVKIHSIH